MMHSALTDTHVVPKRELLRATLIAAVVAAVLLTVAVLPAEYGIDVTGLGKAMGLTKLHAAPEAPVVQTTSQGVSAACQSASKTFHLSASNIFHF